MDEQNEQNEHKEKREQNADKPNGSIVDHKEHEALPLGSSMTSDAEHNSRAATIATRVAAFHSTKTPFRIYHGSTNSTRNSARQRHNTVDTSRLNNVLAIDIAARTALVEPNVPMDALVKATLAHGLLPPVVPEFPGITVGGAFAGTAGESSSFRYGFFDATVLRIEIVTADGSVVAASRTENAKLFVGAVGTFGTLGVLTLLQLTLMETKPFVELTYHYVGSFELAVEAVRDVTVEPKNDFVDGIMFSKTSGAVITGRFTNDLKGKKPTRFTRRHDQWFYLHAKKQISKNAEKPPVTDCVPIVDYLFRYDRGGFWVGKFAFDYFKAPFDRVGRFLMDTYLHTRLMYHGLHASGLYEQFIIEDLALPEAHCVAFLDFIDQEFAIYPLWLCPLKTSQSGLSPRHLATSLQTPLLNVGVWGRGPKSFAAFVAANRKVEAKVKELGGLKWLYAQTFYTEQEFWEIYDREAYEAVRAKYDATHLPSVYDKIKHSPRTGARSGLRKRVGNVWPFRGLYGVWKVVVGREYIWKERRK
jgi:FAD/FMN-containing dehydrogenase